MIVRVDKCSTFGIKKSLTKSVQYLPKLLINNKLIPAINFGDSFQYLGKHFDFNMTDKEHKIELLSILEVIVLEIDLKPLHPENSTYLLQYTFSIQMLLAFYSY